MAAPPVEKAGLVARLGRPAVPRQGRPVRQGLVPGRLPDKVGVEVEARRLASKTAIGTGPTSVGLSDATQEGPLARPADASVLAKPEMDHDTAPHEPVCPPFRRPVPAVWELVLATLGERASPPLRGVPFPVAPLVTTPFAVTCKAREDALVVAATRGRLDTATGLVAPCVVAGRPRTTTPRDGVPPAEAPSPSPALDVGAAHTLHAVGPGEDGVAGTPATGGRLVPTVTGVAKRVALPTKTISPSRNTALITEACFKHTTF